MFWRREREAFAGWMLLTGAPLREEESFVLDTGNTCTSGVVVTLRLPTTQCGALDGYSCRCQDTDSLIVSASFSHESTLFAPTSRVLTTGKVIFHDPTSFGVLLFVAGCIRSLFCFVRGARSSVPELCTVVCRDGSH